MSARTKGRERAARDVMGQCAEWASSARVAAVAVVGSYAYGRPRQGSDLDLVVLSDDPEALIGDRTWAPVALGNVTFLRMRDWGAITELRFRRRDGLQVEVGLGRPTWMATDPLDEGTAYVVADGCLPLYDPSGQLSALAAAVRQAGTCGFRRRAVPPVQK